MNTEPVHMHLNADPEAPGAARFLVRRVIAEWDGVKADDAELVASELVANAAEHGSGDLLEMTVRRHGARSMELTVRNAVEGHLELPERPWAMPGADSVRGRGLAIIETLCTSAEVVADDDTVKVSAVLPLTRDRSTAV